MPNEDLLYIIHLNVNRFAEQLSRSPTGAHPYKDIPNNVDATIGALELLRKYKDGRLARIFSPAVTKSEEFLVASFDTENIKNTWTGDKDNLKTVSDYGFALYNHPEVVSDALAIIEKKIEEPPQEKNVMMQNIYTSSMAVLTFLSRIGKRDILFEQVQRRALSFQQPDGSFYAQTESPSLFYLLHGKFGSYRRELTASFIKTFVDELGYQVDWNYQGRKPIKQAARRLFHPNLVSEVARFSTNNLYYNSFYRSTPLSELNAKLSVNPGMTVATLNEKEKSLLRNSALDPSQILVWRIRESHHLLSIAEKLEKAISR